MPLGSTCHAFPYYPGAQPFCHNEPLDDSEMSHIIEHSENMPYTTVKLYQYLQF